MKCAKVTKIVDNMHVPQKARANNNIGMMRKPTETGRSANEREKCPGKQNKNNHIKLREEAR